MLRMSSLLCWMASCQKLNFTQEPSCLLQLAPQAETDPTCISSSQWTEQFSVEPQPPPVPERGSHWTSAALKGNFALMSWSQFVSDQPAVVPALALIYGWEDGEWKLNANLTALASWNSTDGVIWAVAALSVENIAIAYGVSDPSRLPVYSFLYTGTAWTLVNVQEFLEGVNCQFGRNDDCIKLGGDLMVFRTETTDQGGGYGFETFQWQGTSWSLVPTANITNPPGVALFRFAVDGQRLVLTNQVFTPATVPIAYVYDWTGSTWDGPSASFTPQSNAIIMSVAVEGNYILTVLSLNDGIGIAKRAYVHEYNGSSWEEVYSQVVGDPNASFNEIRDSDISISGKAVVTVDARVDPANVRRIVSFFEKGIDNLWGPTQTLVFNNVTRDSAVGISTTAALVTGFEFDSGSSSVPFNVTATGMILGCDTTETTTPMPPYGYSYYSRHSRRFRRARCPKWCAAIRWWHWRCMHCY
ncbi:unnamed protein product [Symbiodinium sp. CCMP2592]|nr:unnamed protein product [Symbiodinium sp. CCMP2592]